MRNLRKNQMINVAAGIILKDDKVLIAKRPDDKHMGGLWEFPGGKIESNETPLEGLIRELKEEINIDVKQAVLRQKIIHNYPTKSVCLFFYIVSSYTGLAKGLEGQLVQWVSHSRIGQFNFPEANQTIVEQFEKQQLISTPSI